MAQSAQSKGHRLLCRISKMRWKTCLTIRTKSPKCSAVRESLLLSTAELVPMCSNVPASAVFQAL